MEITIKVEPKEIAALLLEIEKQLGLELTAKNKLDVDSIAKEISHRLCEVADHRL